MQMQDELMKFTEIMALSKLEPEILQYFVKDNTALFYRPGMTKSEMIFQLVYLCDAPHFLDQMINGKESEIRSIYNLPF